MNGMVNVVLYFPRYMMITGITVLALAFCMPELRAMEKPDFERLLPIVLTRDVPTGVVGLLLAGLLAAFMSNFAATLNAAPAYIVNDIYKRFINPNTTPKADVAMSRFASLGVLVVGIVFGLLTTNILDVMMWIVGALYGGYVIANVLKWYWWRFNGYGYFWGMLAGILGAMIVPELVPKIAPHIFSPQLAAIIQSNPLYMIPVLIVLSLPAACSARFSPSRKTTRPSRISTKRRAPGDFGARSATRLSPKIPRSSPIETRCATARTSPSESFGNCA